jgi:hypothetical protein
VILDLVPGDNWFRVTGASAQPNTLVTLTLAQSPPADLSLNVWVGPDTHRLVRTNGNSKPLQPKLPIPLGIINSANWVVALQFIKGPDDKQEPVELGNVMAPATVPHQPRDNYDQATNFDRVEPFNTYYMNHGQLAAFGDVTSRVFRFLGCSVQMYQRAILQSCGGGPVQLMNVLDYDLLYSPLITTVDGSPLPSSDGGVISETPSVGDPNYAPKVNAFIDANVMDSAPGGEPVNFKTFFLNNGGLEIFGAPTSRQVVMPGVIYQRFQRTILQYHQSAVNPTQMVTEPMLLADYIKRIMYYPVDPTLTPDPLLLEVGGLPPNHSPYFYQYCWDQPSWLCNPQDLDPGATDLTAAFEPG